MITRAFIEVVPTDRAQTFTILPAQWADGYFQQDIFAKNGSKVDKARFWHQQTRIRHIALRKGVQFGEIDIKGLQKVGQTANAFKSDLGLQIHLQQDSLRCACSPDSTA